MPLTGRLCMFIAVCLPATLYGSQCTTDDVDTFSSSCNNGVRHHYFYWTSACDIAANSSFRIPPPYTVPCDCPAGMGLVGNTCRACERGTFSLDGEVINDWGNWSRTGLPGEHLGFVTHCEMEYEEDKICSVWGEEGYGAYLTSGNQSRASGARSILILDKEFINVNGSAVIFKFRVDGVECDYWECEGLEFYIDGVLVMNKVTKQLAYKQFQYNVTKGHHRMKWVYYKYDYYGKSSAEQKAYIQSITLIGTASENIACHRCPVGSFSSSNGSHLCELCEDFHYQNKMGQSQCLRCPRDSYSLGGAAECTPKPNCTQDDVVVTIEPVDKCYFKNKTDSGGVRTLTRTYLTPFKFHEKLCDDSGKAPLHNNSDYSCFCQPGQMLVVSESSSCQLCPMGSASSKGITCMSCLAGTAGLRGRFFHEWTVDTMKQFRSSCDGDCDSDGWIPSGDHVRTGRAVGTADSYLTLDNIIITAPQGAAIEFSCSVNCHITVTDKSPMSDIARLKDCHLYFEMTHDGEKYSQLCGSDYWSMWWDSGYRDGSMHTHTHTLTPGNYSFAWKFHQQDQVRENVEFEAKVSLISIVGVDVGSAKDCMPCPPGYWSSDGASQCTACRPGYYSKGNSSECSRCEGRTFTNKAGSASCKSCGVSTNANPDHRGCDLKDCSVTFMLAENGTVQYNMSPLQRFNESMIEARKDGNGYYRYYLNPCSTVHDNSSCSVSGKPIPAMACRQVCWSGYFCYTTSLGDTIGFQKAQNALDGLTLQFTYGDICYDGAPMTTTVHMMCDQYAGVGQPQRYGNNTFIEVADCQYVLEWRSTYACPICTEKYFSAVYGKCRDNGKREKRFVKTQPCWSGYTPNNTTVNCYRGCIKNDFQVVYSDCFENGTRVKSYVARSPCQDGYVPDGPKPEKCYRNCTKNDFQVVYSDCFENGTRVKSSVARFLCQDGYVPDRPKLEKCSSSTSTGSSGSGKKVAILVGIGVTVIALLIVVVLFFCYRNRRLRYQYYTALGSARPMEKLGIVDDTEDEADNFRLSPGSDTDGDNPFSSDI